MPKTTSPEVENLIRVKAKLAHARIQGHYSLNKRYHLCMPDDPQAEYFCPLGAISAVTGNKVLTCHRSLEARFLARAIGKKNNPLAIMAWNDDPETSTDMVLKAMDKAISLARAAERKRLKDKAHARSENPARADQPHANYL